VTHAAKRAGVERRRLYERRDADEAFAAAWVDAYDQGGDVIRDEIRRRAVEGWEEPVFGPLGPGQGSGEIGSVRKFSDRLLELEAKRRDPGYRDNHRLEVTGAGGGPVELGDHRRTSIEAVLAFAIEHHMASGLLEQLERLGFTRVEVEPSDDVRPALPAGDPPPSPGRSEV
jgi:hypothetical protein